ncbi:PPC domain-containing protein [Forsythia ovata]|uniref:PPC domain-containing protein n=1 Tax=Forsythia ovata TaxID=205694 RepID=A0ABD1W441_9LAMI
MMVIAATFTNTTYERLPLKEELPPANKGMQLQPSSGVNTETSGGTSGSQPQVVMIFSSVLALALYLNDGDPQHRLRKSVSEVKQQRPDVLRHCQKLGCSRYIVRGRIHSLEDDNLFSQVYCSRCVPYLYIGIA